MSNSTTYSTLSQETKRRDYSIKKIEKNEYVLKVDLINNIPEFTKNNPNPNNLPVVRKKASLSPAAKKCIIYVLFFISTFSLAIVAGYKGSLLLFR